MENQIINHSIKKSIGPEEATCLELVTDMANGKSYLLLSKTVTERYETKDLAEAEAVFAKITGGNGRKLYKPKDLI